MLRVHPVSREPFRGTPDLVDVDPLTGHISAAPAVIKRLAMEACESLMANGILDSLRAAKEMADQVKPDDPWAAEVFTIRANAQVVLHRVVPACLDYLKARRWIRKNRYLRRHTSINLAQLDLMIKFLQHVLSTPEKAYGTARTFDIQSNANTCDEDILLVMAQGQGFATLPPNELRGLLSERQLSRKWTNPRGNMLLIPDDDDTEPSIVNSSGLGGLKRILGSSALVRELMYSEEILAQRRGEAQGFPEGHMYSVWECVSREVGFLDQSLSTPLSEDAKAQRPNHRARKLLQVDYLSGPILLQVVTLLKNATNHLSLVLLRAAPPPWAQLEGGAWLTDRQEWLVMNEAAIFHSVPEYLRFFDGSKEYGGLWARW